MQKIVYFAIENNLSEIAAKSGYEGKAIEFTDRTADNIPQTGVDYVDAFLMKSINPQALRANNTRLLNERVTEVEAEVRISQSQDYMSFRDSNKWSQNLDFLQKSLNVVASPIITGIQSQSIFVSLTENENLKDQYFVGVLGAEQDISEASTDATVIALTEKIRDNYSTIGEPFAAAANNWNNVEGMGQTVVEEIRASAAGSPQALLESVIGLNLHYNKLKDPNEKKAFAQSVYDVLGVDFTDSDTLVEISSIARTLSTMNEISINLANTQMGLYEEGNEGDYDNPFGSYIELINKDDGAGVGEGSIRNKLESGLKTVYDNTLKDSGIGYSIDYDAFISQFLVDMREDGVFKS